jgi:DNA-binding beta-propeller fold protein YncE
MWTMTTIRIRLLVLSFVASGILGAQSTPSPALLVLAKRDSTLAIVDPSTLKVVAHIPVGPDPHEVIADADGRLAYASNYGGGAYHTLAVVDLVGERPLSPVDLGPLTGPHGLTFVAGKVWFTAEGAKVIGRYDPSRRQVDWVLGTGQDRTHMIFVAPDLKRIVASNVSSGTMSVIDQTPGHPFGPPPGPRGGAPSGTTGSAPGGAPPGAPAGPPPAPRPDWEQTVIKVGGGSEGFDVSPDQTEIWVANAQDGTISIIDFAAKRVIQTLDANVGGANRLKFTPDGKLVFVSSLRSPDLAIFDAATRREAKRVKLGHGSAGILMQPDGSRAYVACSPDNYVAVIDLKSLEVVGHIEPGNDPDGLAWAVRH